MTNPYIDISIEKMVSHCLRHHGKPCDRPGCFKDNGWNGDPKTKHKFQPYCWRKQVFDYIEELKGLVT